MRFSFFIFLIVFGLTTKAQTLGGQAAYNFLKLPSSPLLSASGGVNVSYQGNEVGMASNQPALLNENLHTHLQASFNNYFAGINAFHLTGAYHLKNINTTVGASITYLNYGQIPQTDAAGNEEGNFTANDFVFQISASRKYLEKWQYGVNLKFIQSNLGQYKSSAIAFDVGLHFNDTANHFSAGLLVKNMGAQLTTYNGVGEDLPFDLQAGITKRLAKAPFGFSITAQQLHTFDIFYNDTTFNNEHNFSSNNSFGEKLFNHFIIASHVYLGNNLEVALGYNRLRRSELNLGSSGNGLNGFSAGFRAKFNKLQVLYTRSYFQRNATYNQFAININMNQLFGIGSL